MTGVTKVVTGYDVAAVKGGGGGRCLSRGEKAVGIALVTLKRQRTLAAAPHAKRVRCESSENINHRDRSVLMPCSVTQLPSRSPVQAIACSSGSSSSVSVSVSGATIPSGGLAISKRMTASPHIRRGDDAVAKHARYAELLRIARQRRRHAFEIVDGMYSLLPPQTRQRAALLMRQAARVRAQQAETAARFASTECLARRECLLSSYQATCQLVRRAEKDIESFVRVLEVASICCDPVSMLNTLVR